MNRALGWGLAFTGWALALVVPLIWDDQTSGAVGVWLRESIGLSITTAFLIVGGVGLFGIAVAAVALRANDRQRAWATWRHAFRYAGPASDLDAGAVVGRTRPMDQTFVAAPRALTAPTHHRQSLDVPPSPIADDATAFLDRATNQGLPGVLIQGRSLAGKTRLIAEWLRSRPQAFVLAPEPALPVPELPAGLHRRLDGDVVLWLDDLDAYSEQAAEWAARVADLRGRVAARRGRLFVVATVRDGGPAVTVESDPALRALREGLAHVEIEPPTLEHVASVAEATRTPFPPDDLPERSFAFLLGRTFEEQRARYRALEADDGDASRAAVRWLLTSKLLDDRAIQPSADRVRGAAAALFGIDPEAERRGVAVLRREGFVSGPNVDPAFLAHVVPDPTRFDPGLQDRLEDHVGGGDDVDALVNWGTTAGLGGDRDRSDRLLDRAAVLLVDRGTPEGLQVAALARMNGATIAMELGDPHRAHRLWREAIKHGRASGTSDALLYASLAMFDRANAYRLIDGNLSRAAEGYVDVLRQTPELGPAGQELGARASGNLGMVLARTPGREADALGHLLQAVVNGVEAATPLGLTAAARASANISKLSRESGETDSEGDDAAVQYGEAAGTVDGAEIAAEAALRLGDAKRDEGDFAAASGWYDRAGLLGLMVGTPEGADTAARAGVAAGTLQIARDPDRAIEIWQAARIIGEASGTETGRLSALTAGFNIAHAYQDLNRVDEAIREYEVVVQLGPSVGTSHALELAASAGSNRAVLLHSEGDDDGAFEAWKGAVEHGRGSGTSDGLEVAAQGGNNVARHYSDSGDLVRSRKTARGAVLDGLEADSPLGLQIAAAAGLTLGSALRVSDPSAARQAWTDAADHGRRSGTAGALATSAMAEYNLACALIEEGDPSAARAACTRAIETADVSTAPEAAASRLDAIDLAQLLDRMNP